MTIGRPMPPLILDDVERETLERWVRRPKTAQALALRARMVLACAEGRSNTAVGAELGVSDETVGKWRSRFVEGRLDGLSDEPRSGRPRSVTDDDVERVITLTLETTPRDATHWSTFHGPAQRVEPQHGEPHLAGLRRSPTAPKPSSCRRTPSSSRRCGTSRVFIWTHRTGLGLVRGREVPDPGSGPEPAIVANASGTGGTAHP